MSEISDKFQIAQEEIREKIFKVAPDQAMLNFQDRNYLEEILTYGEEVCSAAFGDFGKRLYEVAQELDMHHPDIESGRFLTTFTEDDDAAEKIVQMLKLYTWAKQSNLDALDNLFSKCATKTLFPAVKTSLAFLKNRQQFVRLFSDRKEIDRLRHLKTRRLIPLKEYIDKVAGRWGDIVDLTLYERFGDFHKRQLAAICARAEVFKQMGLHNLETTMYNDIKEFGLSVDYKYYGFQRIPLTLAAIVLGKMHECEFEGKQITMPSSNFAGYDFETGSPVCITGSGGSFRAVERQRKNYTYSPMVCPLHTLNVSKRIQEIVDYLDNFPEANHKPIFDHFAAVVPGIDFVGTKFYDHLGKPHSYGNFAEVRTALDTILIQEKYIVPAILGERDGKFYFVCFWE